VTESLNQIVSRYRRLEQQARTYGYSWLSEERNRAYEELTEEFGQQIHNLREAMGDLVELYSHDCEWDEQGLCIYCFACKERRIA
jgi:hypothetical protein